MQQADDLSGDKRRGVLHFRAVEEHGNKKRRDGSCIYGKRVGAGSCCLWNPVCRSRISSDRYP